jgi:hypothetical protein
MSMLVMWQTTNSVFSRLENGTGKSRPDRHRIPSKPSVNCFVRKTGKPGKPAGTGAKSVEVFSRPFFRLLYSTGKIPREFPVFLG